MRRDSKELSIATYQSYCVTDGVLLEQDLQAILGQTERCKPNIARDHRCGDLQVQQTPESAYYDHYGAVIVTYALVDAYSPEERVLEYCARMGQVISCVSTWTWTPILWHASNREFG